MGSPLSFYCPMWDSLLAMFFNVWFLLYQIFRYFVFGDGWFRDYYMELSVYTNSDFLDEKSCQRTLSDKDTDASRPANVPDIEIMTVRHTCLTYYFHCI
jgi:choline dehydrogenase